MAFKDTLLGLLIILIWGINFVVIVWGLNGLPPLLMGGLRFTLVFLIGFLFVKKPNIPLKWIAAYALLISFGQFAFLFSAMSLGMPAGMASLVLQSQALFTVVFAALMLQERIKLPQILAILIAGIGLYIIGATEENNNMTAIGFGLSIASAISWALGNVINKVINQQGYKPGIDLVIWSAWIPIIPFLLSSYFIEGPELIIESLIAFSWVSFFALCYLAIGASIIGYSLWSYLLGQYPMAQVAPLTLGVPIVGISASSFFLNETISTTQWIGAGVVLLGLMINIFGSKVFTKVKLKNINV